MNSVRLGGRLVLLRCLCDKEDNDDFCNPAASRSPPAASHRILGFSVFAVSSRLNPLGLCGTHLLTLAESLSNSPLCLWDFVLVIASVLCSSVSAPKFSIQIPAVSVLLYWNYDEQEC